MQQRPLLYLLSACAIALAVWGSLNFSHLTELPFELERVNSTTLRVIPTSDRTLPPSLRAGDLIYLPAQSFLVRGAIQANLAEWHMGRAGEHLTLEVTRGGNHLQTPFTIQRRDFHRFANLSDYLGVVLLVLLCVTVLLTLWRGRDWGAWGISLWALAFMAGLTFQTSHFTGYGIWAATLNPLLFGTARLGSFVMADNVAGSVFGTRGRRTIRWLFITVLILCFAYKLTDHLLMLFRGLILPRELETIWMLPFLVVVLMLLYAEQTSDPALRQRLRWMFFGALVFTVGIQISNTAPFGHDLSFLLETVGFVIGMTSLLYAVLRHRVVDLSFVVNRALVYSASLTLIVAVFTLLETFLDDLALPENANLVVQLGVPLAIGFTLQAVHTRLEHLFEQVFYRRKFKRETVLRRFTLHCAYIEHPDHLLDEALRALHVGTDAPSVAFYWRAEDGYERLGEVGLEHYPAHLGEDDGGLVALRAERSYVSLEDLGSALGEVGLLLPMLVQGELLGAVICANRPGETYPNDERELAARLVHEVGLAMHALRTRAQTHLLTALASGELSPQTVVERARALNKGGNPQWSDTISSAPDAPR